MRNINLQKLILSLSCLSLLHGTPETKEYNVLLENKMAYTTIKAEHRLSICGDDLAKFNSGDRAFLDFEMNKALSNRPKSIPPFKYFLDEARIDEDKIIVPVVMQTAAFCFRNTAEDEYGRASMETTSAISLTIHDPRFTRENEISIRWSGLLKHIVPDPTNTRLEYYDSFDTSFNVLHEPLFGLHINNQPIQCLGFPTDSDSFERLCDDICVAEQIASETNMDLVEACQFLNKVLHDAPGKPGVTITKNDDLFSFNHFEDGIPMLQIKFTTQTDAWYTPDYAELKDLDQVSLESNCAVLQANEAYVRSVHLGNHSYTFSNPILLNSELYMGIMNKIQKSIHNAKWLNYPDPITFMTFNMISLSNSFADFN